MKVFYLITLGFLMCLTISSLSQIPLVINLHDIAKNKGFAVFNRELSLINEESHSGIRLSKDEGEGVAWIKGIEFSNGIIEPDISQVILF